MSTSKKHYIAVAKELKELMAHNDEDIDNRAALYAFGYQQAVQDVAQKLADIYQQDNPQFDRVRFMKAVTK